MAILMVVAVLAIMLLLAFFRASITSWVLAVMVIVPVIAILARFSDTVLLAVGSALLVFILFFGVPFMRRHVVSGAALKIFRKILPQISTTEQEAIDAGTVWWDGELFSGNPDWNKLLAFPKPSLSSEEQAFLDKEVEQLCAMLDDWDITHNRADLSPEAWQFIRDKGFFGMIIPKLYGGLEFSAQAHSAVISKISSRSGTAAVTVMVPNSLGPAELLLHYGTNEQKEQYLHRLAKGLEVPCFALTGPLAGSDAGAIPDFGVVCYGEFAGKQNVLGVSLTWEKRYITLAPMATLLGLAFKLYDPDHLLGGEPNRGITLALIPAGTPGVQIGRRHFPLNSAFLNGPTQGKDVFIPMNYIIGGPHRIGQGWRMLMECLAAGRSISLPASSIGGMKLAARTSGAYSRVRKQFKVPIGKFEGVEEPLARIGAHTYMVDAASKFTALAVDLGEKPSVISAVIKYHSTERARIVINDAMDVHGGKGICLGPDNYLGRLYQQIPIAITVEGANILTRTLMIFGQGAIRSHPYVLKEIAATQNHDHKRALRQFDEALFGHISFALSNAARSFVFGLTAGHGIQTPQGNETRRYYQRMTCFSAAFALSADVTMAALGGSLKRREKISARLGDVLSLLYLCSAALKRFEDDGRPAEDLPLLHWAMQDALYKIQQAFDGVIQNFPNALVRGLLSVLVFPLGQRLLPPSDHLGHQIATLLMQPGAARDRLTAGMYIPTVHGKDKSSHARSPHLNPLPQAGEEANESLREICVYDELDAVGALEAALASTLAHEPLLAVLEDARKAGKLKERDELLRISEARDKGIINVDQALQLDRDYALRRKVIMVDDFAPEQLQSNHA
ncbi:MAG: acyl-CoA dehydrogenase [Gallionellales bacterium RIFCSPLOWO2_12_FULL_57_18]|nr:MAG: acyl-CoA dehydrogenase [Gallionellales bacterium RIFCSPLOWO2_12_FULL_57_18]OGS95398.1 MAG: acyl-CoA dehydrogenase [Gallionellales bacterium RIFCSPLOWO2_02_FULL_57_47]OGT16026.1 MAG: acyl-CoA dehydrogenase [Gallionellales bacterium RIFCSPHIGHO2_02_FULL_57_16]